MHQTDEQDASVKSHQEVTGLRGSGEVGSDLFTQKKNDKGEGPVPIFPAPGHQSPTGRSHLDGIGLIRVIRSFQFGCHLPLSQPPLPAP